MRKLILAAFFIATFANADNQATMLVFKCVPENSKKSTIVTWQDVKEEDGWHRYASWSDRLGDHYGVELYFNASTPNDNGQIEDIFVFGKMNSKMRIAGPAISMIANKKEKKLTYSITNDKAGSDARNPIESGNCFLTDKR
ncbi:hypothetical protein [Serratia proteamaculans]|uniref:hypothetical protein n=1 Tax=Serratia proteamaculans TaxID=28151 RepID=UPI003D062260